MKQATRRAIRRLCRRKGWVVGGPGEGLSLGEAVAAVMIEKGYGESEAKELVLNALADGELTAYTLPTKH